MKTLIVFFSRTNTTKKVAQTFAQKLNGETEEIKGIKNYSGPIGYLKAGREAMKKISAKIEPAAKNPAGYDLVIIGTPIWSFNVASPVRAYLEQNKNNFKKTAFFCVMGGSGDKNAFAEMEKISGQAPASTLTLLTKEVVADKTEEKINEFLAKIK
ncbi:MAG TPA: flavodoxin [Candidatus Portnoybacteria bacterium]|nr:flavodoxin [Candidatus Portnoybacteria bacterium]